MIVVAPTPAPLAVASRAALEQAKIRALATGLRIERSALDLLGGPAAPLTVHEYATTGGITLDLPHRVSVNAPFDAPYCATSDLQLVGEAGRLVLVAEDPEMRIDVLNVHPLPGYLEAVDGQGRRLADTTMSHADRIRVSPIDGCAYDCAFCNVAALKYVQRPLEQVLAGIDVALADAALPPRHLLISGGSPSLGHAAGQAYFTHLCLGVLEHLAGRTNGDGSPFEVDIMMSARPDGPTFVREMTAAGVAGFSLNVEVFTDASASEWLGLKHRRARPHLEAMIAAAVDALGANSGRVRSLIIPGLESVDDTLAGIEWLASRGCSPVLSPFRPAPSTRLEARQPVAEQDLRAILDEARRITARHGVALGPRCAACAHNTLTFPWDLPEWGSA